MAAASSPESDGPDSAMNFVDEILEEHLDSNYGMPNGNSTPQQVPSDSDRETSDSPSAGSSEGSVIDVVPLRRPDQEKFVWVDQIPHRPISVLVPPPQRPWQYKSFDVGIRRIVKEVERKGTIAYTIETRDRRQIEVRYTASFLYKDKVRWRHSCMISQLISSSSPTVRSDEEMSRT